MTGNTPVLNPFVIDSSSSSLKVKNWNCKHIVESHCDVSHLFSIFDGIFGLNHQSATELQESLQEQSHRLPACLCNSMSPISRICIVTTITRKIHSFNHTGLSHNHLLPNPLTFIPKSIPFLAIAVTKCAVFNFVCRIHD